MELVPFCLNCKLPMVCEKNGHVHAIHDIHGMVEIRMADRWRCNGCNHKTLHGLAQEPVWKRGENEDKDLARYRPDSWEEA